MKKFTLFVLLFAGLTFTGRADEARLLRFPATNGQEVVFTYAGDLYKVSINGGEAQRLTSHIGYEMFAKFSPDGKSIAFTGQYDGNTEVYLIPSEGGEPKRLTYTATNERDDIGDRMGPNNIVMTWSPDGKHIVFRNRISESFDGKLWTVSPDGGMPEVIPLPEGGFCSYSPDGKLLAYNRVMREFRTWKYYRGGMADEIWIYDPKAQKVDQITDNIAQDIFPMWVGDEIFFCSDRDHIMNIFVYDTKTKQTEKVTDFKEYDVKFPSTNGQMIVFENGGYIYKLDPKTRNSEKINISLTSDNIYARPEMKKVAGNVTATSVSPDGHRLAVTARGEVFDVPVGNGVTRNITRTPGANEREAQWSPDGKHIAYIGDITGESEIWLYTAETGETEQLTKKNDTYIRSILWSPDSKKVFYTDRKNRIVEVTLASKTKRTLMEEPSGEFRNVNCSPDSKWLTYTKSGDNNMSVVYVYNIESGAEYPVTEKWYSSNGPVFSSDGKYLIFDSERDLNPTYSSIEWNYSYSSMGGVYMALLAADTPSPLLPKDGLTDDDEPKGPKGSGGPKPDEAKDEKEEVVVKIDPDGLPNRLVKLPLGTARYNNFYSDGKKVWYSAMPGGSKVFDLKEQKEEPAAEGYMVTVAPNGKKAILRKGGGGMGPGMGMGGGSNAGGGEIYVVDFPVTKGPGPHDKPVDLSNMVAPVDYAQEWPQVFDEVWRAFRDGFYLENMHGLDWKALKEKYAVLLPHVKTRLDLNYVIGEMISELACGHTYANPGETPKVERIPMGLLGAEISRDKSGFFRIDKILTGDVYRKELRSPLTEPGMDVKEGDFIVSINGIPTNSVDNIYMLLIGKANVLTELGINGKASEDGARKVVVEPVADEYPLYHYEWVQNNIRKVEEATDGRVGYIYIPDMGPEGLNEFARYYYPQLDKEALIIDDRANGGGNVSPMIIERLLREPYRLTFRRGSDKIGTVPNGTLVGPKVVLINKYSASDGDLFPWSFKAAGIGTLIGTRTWGGIIGIGGPLPYMDGTDVRVPGSTYYDPKTGQWIVENHGVDPDILIDNDPIKEQAGIDEQLDKAIEVILEQLKDRKPLPPIPTPRTYKDLGVQE